MVDASALSRLAEAREALSSITEHEKMKGKPLLIFANKQDCEGAISEAQMNEQLDLENILGVHTGLSNVVCRRIGFLNSGYSDLSTN